MNEFDDFDFPELSPEAGALDEALQSIGFGTYEEFKSRLKKFESATKAKPTDGWESFLTDVIRTEKNYFLQCVQAGDITSVMLCLFGLMHVRADQRPSTLKFSELMERIRKNLVSGGVLDLATRYFEEDLGCVLAMQGISPTEEVLAPMLNIQKDEVEHLLKKHGEKQCLVLLLERVREHAMKIVAKWN